MKNAEKNNASTSTRKANWQRQVVIIAGLVIFFLILVVGAVEYTSRTQFCSSCHEMKAAYTGWEKGIHGVRWENDKRKEIHCYGCHTDKGLVATVKTKLNGLKEVYIHFTQEVDMDKVQTSVPDRRCLECHKDDVQENQQNPDKQHIVDFHKQHQNLGFTCMDCHRGVGHSQQRFDGFTKESCKTCHQANS